MRISIIVAAAENHVIGRENQIPWRLPADQRKFKALTMGHHLIFGRRTYESIGRPLPGRSTLVVTRQSDYQAPGCTVLGSLDEALRVARASGDSQAFIAGGAGLYAAALPVADRIYLTRVHTEIAGDTFFPVLDMSDWEVIESWEHPADDRNDYDFTLTTLDRRGSHALTEMSSFSEAITFLYTDQMDKTVRFYEVVMGLTLVVDQGTCRIYRVSSGGLLGFCDRPQAKAPEGVIFTFVTNDVDAWARRLVSMGYPLEREPQETSQFGIYNCFVRDPNGYLLEIQRFLDSDWNN
jgi:dihydrofolate reductase